MFLNRCLFCLVLVAILISENTLHAMPLTKKEISQGVISRNNLNVSSVNVAPDIPESIDFCGKNIILNRYDLMERFDRELLAMLYMHTSTTLMIKRANRFFPVIEPILKENGVPDDMKYLACIESNLDFRAVSSVKAVGLWQFMSETAKQYGLIVNDEVDERYNIEKSTKAACEYLKKAYSLFGDWPTAAASYNAGFARISNELKRQKAESGMDLWLVDETMRYFFRILACKYFLTNPNKFGFHLKKENLYPPFVTRDTIVTGKVSNWINFSDTLGISFYDLKYFNTWIRSDSLINKDNDTFKVVYPVKEFKYQRPEDIRIHNKNWVTDTE